MESKNKKNKNTKYIRIIIITCISLILLIVCYMALNKQTTNKVRLEINCNGDITSKEYRRGDKFKCNFFNEEYTFTIKSITNNKVIFEASDYGLCQAKEDGRISLTGKFKTFNLTKTEPAKISIQATDVGQTMEVKWDK